MFGFDRHKDCYIGEEYGKKRLTPFTAGHNVLYDGTKARFIPDKGARVKEAEQEVELKGTVLHKDFHPTRFPFMVGDFTVYLGNGSDSSKPFD